MSKLRGKNVLVTRDAKGAEVFAKQLKAYGASPIVTPLLEIKCLEKETRKQMLPNIDTFEWVFFTSKNGVDCFLKNRQWAMDLNKCHIAAVGRKTAQALEEVGYTVHFMPSLFNAEVMAEEFLTKYKTTHSVLFVRGTLSSSILLDAFEQANRSFHCVEVYETRINSRIKGYLQMQLKEYKIDYLTFTSPSTVNAFIQLMECSEEFKSLPAICIGTTTETIAIQHGFTNTIIPTAFTIEGMLQTMLTHSQEKG